MLKSYENSQTINNFMESANDENSLKLLILYTDRK